MYFVSRFKLLECSKMSRIFAKIRCFYPFTLITMEFFPNYTLPTPAISCCTVVTKLSFDISSRILLILLDLRRSFRKVFFASWKTVFLILMSEVPLIYYNLTRPLEILVLNSAYPTMPCAGTYPSIIYLK